MTDCDRWSEVDDFIIDHLIGDGTVQAATLNANAAAGLPAINVSVAQRKMLQLLAKGVGSRRILEIGTLGGFSTILLARALGATGKLLTLELEQAYADVARSNIDNAGLGKK